MLKVTKRQYEIEEKVQGTNEAGEVIFEFDMQITAEELVKINETIKKGIVLGEKYSKDTENEEIVREMGELEKETIELLGEICFKENKEPFIEKMGIFKYEEMIGQMYDFFLMALVEQTTKRADTMNTNLRKITNN